MIDDAIQCSGVSKAYPHFRLDDVDLVVPAGSVMGFIGPNGAGKTTTLRILLGLVHPDAGDVRVLGKAMPREQVVAKREIGYVSEDMRLYPGQSLAFHMEFLRSIFDSWDQEYAIELMGRFGLVAEQRVKGLSHGQRVKAMLLMVLPRRPKLLVLDEPTTGLDPVARREVLREMMGVLADEERTILFSSHNTLDVEQISDHITFIHRGRIIASRDKEAFLDGWRRLRLEVPDGFEIPTLDHVVDSQRSGRIAILTMDGFDSAAADALQSAGANVTAVERMTLEEIFIASCESKEH